MAPDPIYSQKWLLTPFIHLFLTPFILSIHVPLDSFSWNQLAEELKGWLELRDILAIPAQIKRRGYPQIDPAPLRTDMYPYLSNKLAVAL
jgi:hypothetical protein